MAPPLYRSDTDQEPQFYCRRRCFLTPVLLARCIALFSLLWVAGEIKNAQAETYRKENCQPMNHLVLEPKMVRWLPRSPAQVQWNSASFSQIFAWLPARALITCRWPLLLIMRSKPSTLLVYGMGVNVLRESGHNY